MGLVTHFDTGLPWVDVHDDFAAPGGGRCWPGSAAGCAATRTPTTVVSALGMRGQHYLGLQTIGLDTLVGTVDSMRDFDRRFRPTSNRVRQRWERLALAQRRGDQGRPPPRLGGPGLRPQNDRRVCDRRSDPGTRRRHFPSQRPDNEKPGAIGDAHLVRCFGSGPTGQPLPTGIAPPRSGRPTPRGTGPSPVRGPGTRVHLAGLGRLLWPVPLHDQIPRPGRTPRGRGSGRRPPLASSIRHPATSPESAFLVAVTWYRWFPPAG